MRYSNFIQIVGGGLGAALIAIGLACNVAEDGDPSVSAFAGSAAAKVFECTATCEEGSSKPDYDECQQANPPPSSFKFYFCDYSATHILFNEGKAQAHADATCKAHGFAGGTANSCDLPTHNPRQTRPGGLVEPVHRVETQRITCSPAGETVEVLHRCSFVNITKDGTNPIVQNAPNLTITNEQWFPEEFWGTDSWDAEDTAVTFCEAVPGTDENGVPRKIEVSTLIEGKWGRQPFKAEHHRECGPAIDCGVVQPLQVNGD